MLRKSSDTTWWQLENPLEFGFSICSHHEDILEWVTQWNRPIFHVSLCPCLDDELSSINSAIFNNFYLSKST